jgi:DNA polymerase-3 subunit alpha
LIKCGAMDCFGAFRSQMMTILQRALELGARKQKEKAAGQVSFFDIAGDAGGFNKETETLPNMKEWHKTQVLTFEKEILGFYVSGHPLAHYQTEIKEFTDISTKNLKQAVEGEDVRLVGLIEHVKLTNTRRTNERMAILRVEDIEGEVEVVVFPSAYARLADYIKDGEVIFLSGKVSLRDEIPKIIAEDMKHIHDVYGSIKAINVDLCGVGDKDLKDLKRRLSNFPGKIPVYLRLDTKTHKSVEILVGEDLYVAPNERLMNEIKELVGKESFSVTL